MRSFAGDARARAAASCCDAPVHWPRPSVLDAALAALEGVGPKTAEAAAEAGLDTIGDLLFHFPARHRDLRVRELARGRAGRDRHRPGRGARQPAAAVPPRPPAMVSVKVGDDTGHVRATWFNQPWVAAKLTPGAGCS